MSHRLFAALTALLFLALAAMSAMAQDVPRISKEDLKSKLDQVIILDARRGYDWKASEYKIKSAIRQENLEAFAEAHPDKNVGIVVYCA